MHSVGGKKRLNFHPIFSVHKLDRIIAEEHLYFEKDIEVVTTPEDKRLTPRGRAFRSIVWDQFLVSSFRPAVLSSVLQSFILVLYNF